MKNWIRRWRTLSPDVPVLREEPLSRHLRFASAGPARRVAFPKSGEQLVLLVSFRAGTGSARPFVLGNGTNLLFGDRGDGLTCHQRATLRSCGPGE